jgi:hypothetical protein
MAVSELNKLQYQLDSVIILNENEKFNKTMTSSTKPST